MAGTTAYRVCTATAIFITVLVGSLLYAPQLSSGQSGATSLRYRPSGAVTPRNGFRVLAQSDLLTSSFGHVADHGSRDAIVQGEGDSSGSDANITGPQPQERAVVPSEYKTSVKKGEALLGYLRGEASPGSKGSSPWQSFDQLGSWGWRRDVDAADDRKDYSHVVAKGRGPRTRECTREVRLRDIINSDLTCGKQRTWVHSAESTNDGTTYYATRAEFKNQYWPDAGIMIADSNYGAEHMIAQGKASKNPWGNLPLPKLKQWSDINFLTWQSLTSASQRQNLRWIFRRNIMSQETQSLISRVIEKRGDNVLWHIVPSPFKLYEAPAWPGMVLKGGDEGFAALVGSPNVAGICWLLIQHQSDEQLGKKTIRSMRVWKDDSGAYAPHILIELGNVD